MKKTALLLQILILTAMTAFIHGCGGGSGSDGYPPDPQGVVVDSPIQGLHYFAYTFKSDGPEIHFDEDTDANGQYRYKAGDNIMFLLGLINLPPVPAKAAITPFDLFDTSDINNHQLLNFIRLVQTLDDDGDYADIIQLTEQYVDALFISGLDFYDLSLPADEFEALPATQQLLALIGKTHLVSIENAQAHLINSVANSDVIDIDEDGLNSLDDYDDDNDGINDPADLFPWDSADSTDFDSDNIGDFRDPDDDNDGVADKHDDFPLDASQSFDLDNDGSPNTIDSDDDNDGITDGSDTENRITFNLQTGLPEIYTTLFDGKNKLLYICHRNAKSISIISLETGELVKTLDFDYLPGKMTVSPDGKNLYIALSTQEHSSYWYDEDQDGYIAVIDTQSLDIIASNAVSIDPYDIVASSKGKLYVSGGSGQWTKLCAFKADTGTELQCNSLIYQGSELEMSPSEDWLYTTDSFSGAKITQIDLRGFGMESLADLPYYNDYGTGGKLWATPDNDHLITAEGDIFLTADRTFSQSLNDSAPISDVTIDEFQNIAIITFRYGGIWLLNLQSFETIRGLSFPDTLIKAYAFGYYGYYLTGSNENLTLIKEESPCLECHDNHPPVASLEYSPEYGNTTENHVFDASASSDAEDGSNLQYRWDIDADGNWETGFSTTTTFNYKFMLAGNHLIRLQVKDSLGEVTTLTREITVMQGTDPGTTISGGIPFNLNFTVSDVKLDRNNSKLYITDTQAKRLYVVDVATGLAEKYWAFDFEPGQMTISPEGSSLYLGLYHSNTSSYITVIDLAQAAHTNTLFVNARLFDLVATNNGRLIASVVNHRNEVNNPDAGIATYSASDGSVLGFTSTSYQRMLSLHPSENWLFATDSSITKYDISTNVASLITSDPYQAYSSYRFGGESWPSPYGDYVISKGGDLFKSSDLYFYQSLTPYGTSIVDLSFSTDNHSAIFISRTGQYNYSYSANRHALNTWAQTDTYALPATPLPQYIFEANGNIYIISGTGSSYTMTEVPF